MNLQKPEFVHLHVHTEYSILQSVLKIDRLVDRALELEMEAVTITDHGTLFGVLDFYIKAMKAGIRPIIGCEVCIVPRKLTDKTPFDNQMASQLILLVESLVVLT